MSQSNKALEYGDRVRLTTNFTAPCLTHLTAQNPGSRVTQKTLQAGAEFTVAPKLKRVPDIAVVGQMTVLVRDAVGTWCIPAKYLEVVS